MPRKPGSGISPSWAIADWPENVYPGTSSRARYLVRVHRAELLVAGALARVGRDLVIIGPRYERWLQRQAGRVPDFQIAPNRGRPAGSSP
jgi:hypothetical protein